MSHDVLVPPDGWHLMAAARMPAPAPSARGLLFRTVAQFSSRLGRKHVPDVFTVLNINPRLFWAWLFFASRLMPWGRLPARLRELVILRTAWNCRSRYEWGQHVEIALRVGVTDAEIVAATRGPEAFNDPVMRAVVQACDEVFTRTCISDVTWKILSAHFSEKLLIELMILIGHYQMLAGLLNSAGIALETESEAALQAFYQRIAG